MRDWYRDPKSDPEAKEHRERPQRRKKNTKKWCKGVEGREHVTEIIFDRRYSNSFSPKCRAYERSWLGQWYWMCHHIEACIVCGKHIRWRIGKEECPTWLERQ